MLKKIFQQSVTKHNLYYTSICGDGDSKAFPALERAYGPENPIIKVQMYWSPPEKRWDALAVMRIVRKIKICGASTNRID